MVSYLLERTGDRLTENGRFIDFRVANAEASDQIVEWVNEGSAGVERPETDYIRTTALDYRADEGEQSRYPRQRSHAR